jgi:hypothetical protein
MTVPSEYDEQKRVVMYLQFKGMKFTSIPNNTFTTSNAAKSKNKAEGLNPGLPDMLVIVDNHLVFIEMKRQKAPPSATKPHQREWIAALNGCESVQAFICRGADEAINIIDRLSK